jgi:hypothetical protein
LPQEPAPIGSYFTGPALSEDQRRAWDEQAERRRAEIRASAMLMIGRDPEGRPLPSPDAGEEERLASADLRGALREVHAEWHQISLRLVDQKAATERAQQHLDAATAALRVLEDAEAAVSRLESDRLAESFRAGMVEAPAIEASAPATSTLDQARRAVEVAQRALNQLTAEAEATRRELQAAQHRVGLAVLDVVKGELLAIGAEVAALDRQAATLRANLEQGGYVTAALRQRYGWPAQIFTTSTLAAMHPAPPARPPAATVDWQGFHQPAFRRCRGRADAGGLIEQKPASGLIG